MAVSSPLESPSPNGKHQDQDRFLLQQSDGQLTPVIPHNDLALKINVEEEGHHWEHDPENPRNWPLRKKWLATGLVSFYTFITPLGSSMMAPGLPDVALKYSITSPTLQALTLSIFLLSAAIGPLFFAPLSEVYGRVWVLHLSNLAYLAFNLGCALSRDTLTLLVFRLLSGFAGSAPLACGGGVVADLFEERERASAMSLYLFGPLIAPCIGPLMGGFIIESAGVGFSFYVMVALCGVGALLAIPLLRETYAPVIKSRRHKGAPDPEKAAECAVVSAQNMHKWSYIWMNLKRPLILLTHSFICFILSFYMALMYGIYYLMFTTFPDLFSKVYHFSIGVGGLAYLGVGIGFFISAVVSANLADKTYVYLATKNGGIGKPEMRMPPLIFASVFVPVGILWYGWSAETKIHFIMPIIGTAIFGFGLMAAFLAIQLYLVDTFAYAASAIAAASMFRSLLGFAFPLFGGQLFAALGYGGGNSLLAGVAIVIGIPFPIWIYHAGEGIRARSSFSR